MPGGHRVSLKPCSEADYAPRKCVIDSLVVFSVCSWAQRPRNS